jgi:SAM-dependent methyltransferase
MGLIFDSRSARLYEAWYSSPPGRSMERLVERSLPALLDPLPGEKVLDVGCGEGNHLLLLQRLGLDAYGVDASSYMIRRAKKRLGNRASLKVGNADDLPFDDNEFDVAVLINTLEFLDDPLQALREVERVTRRRVFIAVMNKLSFHCLLGKSRSLFRRSIFNDATLYSLWGIKFHLRRVFGRTPIRWQSGHMEGSLLQKLSGHWPFSSLPFGALLCVAIDIPYWVRTEQHPLKVGFGKAGQAAVRGLTMGKTTRNGGASPE